jgi:hypothetical protein
MYLSGYEREIKGEKKRKVTDDKSWIFGVHAPPRMEDEMTKN